MTRILRSLTITLATLALAAMLPNLGGCKPTNAGPQAGGGGGGGGNGEAAVRRPAPPERPELNDELIAAITNDDEDRAIELVEQGASVNARNASDLPVLFLASSGCFECEGAMLRLTQVLLEYGAEVDATVANGLQAIHWVARAGGSDRPGTRETLDLLLKYGADINAESSAGTRPIFFAIQIGNDEWKEFLVSRGARER